MDWKYGDYCLSSEPEGHPVPKLVPLLGSSLGALGTWFGPESGGRDTSRRHLSPPMVDASRTSSPGVES